MNLNLNEYIKINVLKMSNITNTLISFGLVNIYVGMNIAKNAKTIRMTYPL